MPGIADTITGFISGLSQKMSDAVVPPEMVAAAHDIPGQLGYEGERDGQADAMRHMLIIGQLAQRYGSLPAKAIGYVHEAVPQLFLSDGRDDIPGMAMDLHNNAIGAEEGARTNSLGELVTALKGRMGGIERRIPSLLESPKAPVYLPNRQTQKP